MTCQSSSIIFLAFAHVQVHYNFKTWVKLEHYERQLHNMYLNVRPWMPIWRHVTQVSFFETIYFSWSVLQSQEVCTTWELHNINLTFIFILHTLQMLIVWLEAQNLSLFEVVRYEESSMIMKRAAFENYLKFEFGFKFKNNSGSDFLPQTFSIFCRDNSCSVMFLFSVQCGWTACVMREWKRDALSLINFIVSKSFHRYTIN